ncbi:AtpZ/AtpI family protein [Candidatus Uhrbacteria bacterium]|nr:AtpZ/AtpI family protein [Candidatus Uhrbacteria bacterium]
MPASDRQFMIFGIRIMGEFAGLIAVPVILFVLGGRWLDQRWGTGPWMMVGGFVLAFLVSAVMVWRRAKEIGREYQDLVNNGKNSNSQNPKS